MSVNGLTSEQIKARLMAVPKQPQHNPYPAGFLNERQAPAAVLIPLQRRKDGWHVIYIRRTEMPHDRHSGQVAFPGGRVEAEDADIVAAALREAKEEIDMAPQQVRVLGRLSDFITVTNYNVTPVVGGSALALSVPGTTR